jgi:HD-like signal output (HDOD) protein
VGYIIQGMRDLLAKGQDLPTLPTVVFQLHKVLDDERVSDREVAAIIERDPALTGRLLKAANSAAFARGAPVSSVQAAISRLGVNQVRAICIVLAVVRSFGHRAGGLDHQRFWEHSATVAMMAQRIWDVVGQSRAVSGDDVYVAGLLHDAGLLILEQFFQRDFLEARQAQTQLGIPLWKCEEEHLGMDHGTVGGLLLGRWSLPALIAEAVTNHHHPEEAEEGSRPVARVVAAAEAFCTANGCGLPVEGPADLPETAALTAVGCPDDQIAALLSLLPGMAEKAEQFLA